MEFNDIQHQVQQLIARGDTAGACAVLEQYLEIHPDQEDGWLMLTRLSTDTATQIRCWEQIARLSPQRQTPATLLGSLRTLVERRRQSK